MAAAAFDHRVKGGFLPAAVYVIAYAPRKATAPNSQLGLFITTVRDGFNNRWRLLEVSVKPYD